MFLKQMLTGNLVEVLDLRDVFDPFIETITARSQAGEDTMDLGNYKKSDLSFASGEPLPRCWRDSHYRETEA